MQISPAIEQPTRELLGHAIRGEYDDFGRKLAAFKDDEARQESVRLTVVVSAYAAVDDNDGAQLSDADMRELAESVAELETRIEISVDEVHRYLSRVVFGDDPLTAVFSADDALRLPYVIAGTLVAANTHTEDGQKWPDYLDQIEAAIEAAPDPA